MKQKDKIRFVVCISKPKFAQVKKFLLPAMVMELKYCKRKLLKL